MTIEPFALDTNILIYLHDGSFPVKKTIAEELMAGLPKIPSQVVCE